MAILRIQTGPKKGTQVSIEEASLTVGRGDKVGLQIPDHGASRRHSEIFRIGELFFIRDLASRNGTFVNDQKVIEVVLREGDQIRIGDTFMMFCESEKYLASRAMRLHDGAGTMEAVRFRDTMTANPAAALGSTPLADGDTSLEDQKKNLPRTVARIIAGGAPLKTIFREVVRETGLALGADRADILLLDFEPSSGGSDKLELHATATFDTKGEGEVAVSKTILREVLEKKQALLSSDASTDLRFGEADSIISHSIRSVISVPLAAGELTAGVLYVCHSQRADTFDREDLELAAQVGLQLSGVFSRLKEADQRERGLRAALQWSIGDAAGSTAARAADLCRAMALSLDLPPEDIQAAWLSGLLHARGAPENRGSGEGDELSRVADAIRHQDARHNGSGTPPGARGDDIPVLGRILALAKTLAALQPSRDAAEWQAALEKIRSQAGQEFHPDIVQACLLAQRNGLLAGENRSLFSCLW